MIATMLIRDLIPPKETSPTESSLSLNGNEHEKRLVGMVSHWNRNQLPFTFISLFTIGDRFISLQWIRILCVQSSFGKKIQLFGDFYDDKWWT